MQRSIVGDGGFDGEGIMDKRGGCRRVGHFPPQTWEAQPRDSFPFPYVLPFPYKYTRVPTCISAIGTPSCTIPKPYLDLSSSRVF